MFTIRRFFVLVTLISAAALVAMFVSCTPSGDDGGGGGGGIVVKTDSSDVLAKFGSKSVTLKQIASDRRFKMMIQDALFTHMVFEKCANERIEITEADVEEQMAKMRRDFGNDEAELENYVKATGKTMDEVREDQRKFVAITKLLRKRVAMSDEDIRNYYDTQSRNIKQTYAAEHGLTEEETEALTYEQVKSKADEMLFMQRANEEFQGFREDIIREFVDKVQFFGIEPMSLSDWGIETPAETPAAPEPAPVTIPDESGDNSVDDGTAEPPADDASGESESGGQ